MHRAETLNVHHMNDLSLVSPDFFQPSRFQLCWKTSKGWKKWAPQHSLQKSEPLGFHYKNPLGRPFANFRCFLNLNLYPNWRFESEFAFEFGTCILHIPWSWSQTEDDLSASVGTFFEKKNSISSSFLSLQESKLSYIFCCHNFVRWWEWSKQIPFVR